MDPTIDNSRPKTWPVLIAILIVILIGGGATWFYLKNKPASLVVQAPSTTPTTSTNANDPVLNSGKDVTTTLNDLDAQLAQMDIDLKSTDDTSPTL